MRASIVTGSDAPPVFELGEEVLDLVTLPVERLVEIERPLTALRRWNAGFGHALRERLAKPVAVVASIGDQGRGQRQRVEHQPRAFVIAHLTFGQHHDERLAGAVADDVELGVQPAFRAADTAGKSPFFRRLPAVRCAFK